MRKILVNYATKEFRISQKLNSLTGIHLGGFDKVFNYSPKDLSRHFKRKHAEILSNPRGGGYWLWKPYVILQALRRSMPNDILFYCDLCSVYQRN